jgi:D-alanyl-D-alanine carboxypeptidase (penicillin-binding protein 5/6)
MPGFSTFLMLVVSCGLALTAAAAEKPPPFKAKQAILLTYPHGIELVSRNADAAMAPSSMTKMMTALLVIEAIKAGKINATDKIKITKAMLRTRGSRLKPRRGAKITVRALLNALVVGSANDAAKALAIRLAGSEAAFAERMTKRAQALGLVNSQFRNSTGFNAKGHRMSARDVARLAGELIKKHPKYYAIFGRKSVKVGKRRLKNRNPVLGLVKGADGIKTGQTRKGGYGLSASAKRGSIRLILVINGLKSAQARRQEAKRLLEWGFRILQR